MIGNSRDITYGCSIFIEVLALLASAIIAEEERFVRVFPNSHFPPE